MLLLDEITVDLDVVGRLQLLAFFRQECEERGTTIVYATHIFDGLADWVTHLAYMEDGHFVKGGVLCGGPRACTHPVCRTPAALARRVGEPHSAGFSSCKPRVFVFSFTWSSFRPAS